MLSAAEDVSQVDWLLRYSAAEPRVVQSYASAGFPSYARVLNPASGFDGSPVRWSTIAQQVGIELTGETRWSDLAAVLSGDGEPINVDGPDWSPDPGVAQALTCVLERHTVTPQDCYFLVWEGYACVDDHFSGLDAEKIVMSQDRSLFLLKGSLSDPCAPLMEDDRRLPNWWWPAGHEWCVGNEIYSRSVFVGGSEECITAVLAHPELEALPISPYTAVYGELE
jgi:hypothetical protein